MGGRSGSNTHRIGNLKVCKEGKPTPIIIKFALYDVRSTVYTSRGS